MFFLILYAWLQISRMLTKRLKYINNSSYLKESNMQQLRSLRVMGTFLFGAMSVYKREQPLPTIIGGGLCTLSQVTFVWSHTQLSRPITLGHYTSWNADYVSDHSLEDVNPTDQLSWKQSGINAYMRRDPRSIGGQSSTWRETWQWKSMSAEQLFDGNHSFLIYFQNYKLSYG